MTVNRLCASGLAAVVDASRAIACGQGDLFIAGGVESMSRAPFVIGKAERAYGRQLTVFDSTLGSRFANPRTTTQFAAAKTECFFAGELHPARVAGPQRGETTDVTEDEHPRPGTTLDTLAKLRPIVENGIGIVTAGNASGINDGAAAVILGSKTAGERAGAPPLARIVTAAAAGVEPRVMGLGPVPASKKALARAGLALADMDVIEINEAFATQVLGCLKRMELDPTDSRVNPNGGAIAIGHPLGASGARLMLTAVRQLQRIEGRYALVTLCIGVGQGLAAVLEGVP